MKIAYLTAAALVSQASATHEAAQLVSQALAMTESGSAAQAHLESALASMT